MTPKPPVHVLDLFPGERRELLSVLDSLTPEQWQAPTVCAGWSVRDIAAHLLGVDGGAAIIRTHDVAETGQALRVAAAIRGAR